jgi:FixJ family two-component response regulator
LPELGFSVRAFSLAEEFLTSDCIDDTECVLLDVSMPGMTGPELQEELKQRGQKTPIIFITAQRDEILQSQVRQQGATDCLFKPFSDTDLLEALNTALLRCCLLFFPFLFIVESGV